MDPARSIGYVPALDGVRAFAIVLVLFFHGGFAWASGGFFGVDVFFVLSGFLITSLLLAELHTSGSVALGRFWARRARRLLPALFAMLAGVALYAAFLAPSDTLGQLRTDSLATLFYGANWNLVAQGQGYFAALSTPSPLIHTWSLAIEEQFYLVWPIVVLVVVRVTRSLWALLGLSVAGALASALAMDLLYANGAGATRVYYGTDTRAQDLLVGAALAVVLSALVWRRGRSRGEEHTGLAEVPRPGRFTSTLLLVAASAGLSLVLWATVAANSNSSWPYHGGFLVVAVATAALLACVTVLPKSPLALALSLPPVRYLGRISYGLYLWHWPVFLVLDSERLDLFGWALFAVRVAVALSLAVLSFHLLELPIRRGALRSWRGWVATPAAVGATAALLVGTTAGATTSVANAPTASGRLAAHQLSHASDPGTAPAVPAVPAGAGGPLRVLMVGDSEASFLGFGLGESSSRYGIDFTDDGVIGCGLLRGPSMMQGQIETDRLGIRGASDVVPCATQDVRWRADIDTFHPDVVMLSDGEFEVRDRLIDGHWTHIGEPGFDRLELAALNHAIDLLSSTGAKVLVLTAPYYDSGGEQLDGQPWPENQPSRVRAYNALVRTAVAEHPGVAEVGNLNYDLDPSGHYQQYVRGVEVRFSDGIHATPAGGRLVAPRLFHQAISLGQAARATTTAPAAATSAQGPSTPG